MAPKVAKKALNKSIEKLPAIQKPIVKSKTKKRNYNSFSAYIYKVLRTITADVGISGKSMLIMNSLVNDFVEKLAIQSAWFIKHGKITTLSSREVISAVKLLIPGQLGLHAIAEVNKALALYYKSRAE